MKLNSKQTKSHNISSIIDTETLPRVALEFMNNTHLEEIELLNGLQKAVTDILEAEAASDTENEKVTHLLQTWLTHSQAHFDRENRLMQEIQFPAISLHEEEHTLALSMMTTVIQTWEENRNIDLLADYIFTQWPMWFIRHVKSMDAMTAKFALMRGFTEETFS